MNYWLVKSDPETYGWKEFFADKKTEWTGVRNYAARNHMRSMKKNDLVLFYHSGEISAVVGIAKVTKESFQDPTTDIEAWIAVELNVVKIIKREVSLKEIKGIKELKDMLLLKISRLSVMPVLDKQYEKIIAMSNA
ncbi:MAG: EVE domain-containing protein [Chitinophagales bacterium]|nr:EVE domain-containing protein [Chitinophagales bacterium]